MTDPPARANISVSLPVPLIKQLNAMATETQRTRSNLIAVLLEQGLNPVASVTTSSGSGVAGNLDVGASVLVPCADGQHVRAEAKSGSGMIGCKNCGMVKIGPNWVKP